MRRVISNIMAFMWFFGILAHSLFWEALAILIIFFRNILGVLGTWFAVPPTGVVYCFIAGFVLAVTGWVPAFRNCYYKLPWLYPFSMIMTMDLWILSAAELILSEGFSVLGTSRHVTTVMVMAAQVIVCRLIMCSYLEDYPMNRQETPAFTVRIRRGAAVLMGTAVAAFLCFPGKSVQNGPLAEKALETRMSTSLAVGVRLASSDDHYTGGDMAVTHNATAGKVQMWVWDYAREDGDYVQILVNGRALGEPFMLRNEPVSFMIPAVGEIRICGVWDGDDRGITYGVYFGAGRTIYFNGMDRGGSHLYTLSKEVF